MVTYGRPRNPKSGVSYATQFRDPEFSVTAFLDVGQWRRWITPMPKHCAGAIQEMRQMLSSDPFNPVQPELSEPTKRAVLGHHAATG